MTDKMTINVRGVDREIYYTAQAQAKVQRKAWGQFISEALAEKLEREGKKSDS